ncbi:ATP synthase F0F1 subunit alpha [Bacillus cereus]|uniref:ATP synthase F0F1 subunit alpha n=1 Tax=Bacillus TaxID=1386 RepID=UPI00077AE309|nr:ATP synthase F0F1 subunit alpha [Bacillus cereus]KXY55077.1 ATP synthase F0F1 subunit alpha [Bacillus cereus]
MKKVILAGVLGIAALSGTTLPELEATKASAAVASNIQSIEGRVLKVEANFFEIEAKGFNENMDNPNHLTVITTQLNPSVKVGDIVKVTGAIWHSFGDSMTPESVVKITNNNILNHQINGYVTGEIKEIGNRFNDSSNYVIVPYINEYGEEEDIEVRLTQGQKFRLGDKVKINMEFALGRGNLNAGATVIDNIEQVNSNNGVYYAQDGLLDYVVGKITKIDKTFDEGNLINFVNVTASDENGKDFVLQVFLTEGQKFNIGDRVKVDAYANSSLNAWGYSVENNIQKIDVTNTQAQQDDQWIWK